MRARRRLIVNADDFGRSSSINEAVLRAHREGIVTSASLMVGGEQFEEAVEIARDTPTLGVGLHLTLVQGRAVLAANPVPGLVDGTGRFADRPAAAGFRYWCRRSLRGPIQAELDAQFRRFHSTGLRLDHVNGHLHFHLHPVVLRLLGENATPWAIDWIRWTRDSVGISLRSSRGRWAYRLGHVLVFALLCRHARGILERRGLRHVARVFGLLQDGRVDESYLLRLLPLLPAGDMELYSHPSLGDGRHEFEALISSKVRARVEELGIELVRYQDLGRA